MTTYFSSDLHFGHANIINFSGRPFKDVPDMNERLIENWNDTVDPEDTVWVLGDVAMGQIADSLALCAQLNGNKILLCGNHDRPWAGYGQHRNPSKDWAKRYIEEGGFSLVLDGVSVPAATLSGTMGEVSVRLCHFPYDGDHTDQDRYLKWRPIDNGGWLVHGHVHEAWRIRGRQINVGVDQWNYRPVSEETLADIILGHQVDVEMSTV